MARHAKGLDGTSYDATRMYLSSTPPMVEIVWRDHWGVSEGTWEPLEAVQNRADTPFADIVFTVGFLIKETKDYFLVCQSCDLFKGQADMVLKVLKPCVLQSRLLVKSSHSATRLRGKRVARAKRGAGRRLSSSGKMWKAERLSSMLLPTDGQPT